MTLKILISVSLLIFVIFNMKFIDKREYIRPFEQLFSVNELSFKIATNIYSTFYADKFWLISSQIDEASGIKSEEDLKKVEKAFSVINYLDPNFTQPIVYAVAFLIINEKKYDAGMRLLNNAIKKSPRNTKLLFQKLIYITTYNPEKINIEEAMKIAEILYEEKVIYMGALKVSDFIAETIEFYTKNKKDKLANLERLAKFTNEKELREDLDLMIKKYKKGTNYD